MTTERAPSSCNPPQGLHLVPPSFGFEFPRRSTETTLSSIQEQQASFRKAEQRSCWRVTFGRHLSFPQFPEPTPPSRDQSSCLQLSKQVNGGCLTSSRSIYLVASPSVIHTPSSQSFPNNSTFSNGFISCLDSRTTAGT